MSDLTEREILPMADEDIAKLKAGVTRRWDDKPHYVDISPGCMMRAEEILSLIKAYEQSRDKALEEAAKETDGFVAHWGLAYKTMTDQIAAAIRALKEKP